MLQKIIFILVIFYCDHIIGLKQCGDCVFISSCKNAESLENNLDPDIIETFSNALCDFQTVNDISRPKICCSDFTDVNDRFNDGDGDKIAKHNNLGLLPNDCGSLDGADRIIGGTIANLYEYPWMALLSFRVKGTHKINFKCGGTIINSRYILTAAHCMDNKREQLIGVRVGEYVIGSKTDCQGEGNFVCESHIQDLHIKKIIPHENYNKVTKENDIALIRTRTPIDFGHKNVKPICLPVSKELRDMNLSGTTVEVAGWGRFTDMSEKASKILLKVNITVWDEADCVSGTRSSDSEALKILCAGEKGKDSCNGDSGGPLMAVAECLNKNRMVQFGVVSQGPRFCGNGEPGVYTYVAKYIYWILENIEK